jgi:hypothetical protein
MLTPLEFNPMSQQVWKLVIVAEEILSKKLTKLIQAAGATGYTVNAAGGEGSRNVSSTGEPSVSHTLSNVKIEVQTGTRELAGKITSENAAKYYADASIITYIYQVEALRNHKFLGSVRRRGSHPGPARPQPPESVFTVSSQLVGHLILTMVRAKKAALPNALGSLLRSTAHDRRDRLLRFFRQLP